MLVRRITADGFAHHSYLVADAGVAAVIDPRRDIGVYLKLASHHGLKITCVLETHRNEDFVVGSNALMEATGATVLHSGALPFAYGETAKEGDTVDLGKLRLRVLETPGHTRESLSFAVADRGASQDAVLAFTGDALFVGDTGRVDLFGDGEEEHAARLLHHSLFEKILPLGDGVLLNPAHGGGSVCGGAIAEREFSSLGFERLHNPGLQKRHQEDFVRAKLSESHLRAPWFPQMERWNLAGAPIHERLPVPLPLAPGELLERQQAGAVVVDVRMPQAFAGGHIPGSLNVWRGGLAAWLGWMVAADTPVVLVLPDDADAGEVTRTLFRLGHDAIAGTLRGGFETWQNEGRPVGRLGTIDTETLRSRLGDDELVLVDVRKPSEWEQGGVEGAERVFLGELAERADELPKEREIVCMCGVGHRGGVAASLLARLGFPRVTNYLGGYKAWTSSSRD